MCDRAPHGHAAARRFRQVYFQSRTLPVIRICNCTLTNAYFYRVRGVDSVCDQPPHGQPHVVFGRFKIEGWMLLYKELIMAEDNPNITMKRITAV